MNHKKMKHKKQIKCKNVKMWCYKCVSSLCYCNQFFAVLSIFQTVRVAPVCDSNSIDLDEYQLKFWCHTAWCPPNELLQFIADKYKVTVECFYEIEGYGDDGVGKDTFSPNLEEAQI